MSLFSKRSLKRIQPNRERKKITSQLTSRQVIKTSSRLNWLLLALFTLLVIYTISQKLLQNLPIGIPHLASVVVISFLVVFLMGVYLLSFHTSLFSSFWKVFFFGILAISLLIFLAIFKQFKWSPYLLPITFLSMIIALCYSQQLAIITLFYQTFLSCVLLLADPYFSAVIYHIPAALLAILRLSNFRTRARIIQLGVESGILFFLMICTGEILSGEIKNLRQDLLHIIQQEASLGLINGIISGFIFLGILPVLERWPGIITDLRLLELSDMNQPLLRELSLAAPGTYHHSLRVGEIAEAAAEAIGANSLLVRVGAYYHDIGKLNKPEYFIENEQGKESKHKDLSPTMSALIITAHVKDGIEFIRHYQLPKVIEAFVEQHHGTSLVKCFYHEVKESQRKTNHSTSESSYQSHRQINKSDVSEEIFRYPGPKPQSKEVGIVFLADAVEAASRTLSEITPGRLNNLIQEIVTERLLDGQLDQSNLTMWELKKIKEAFIRTLAAIFHSRIKYPNQP